MAMDTERPWFIRRRIEANGFVARRLIWRCATWDEKIYGYSFTTQYERTKKLKKRSILPIKNILRSLSTEHLLFRD